MMKTKLCLITFLVLAMLASGCEEIIPVTNVSIDRTEVKLESGSSLQLHAFTTPVVENSDKIIWNTANPDVATVSDDGTVLAIAPGRTEISAAYGEISKICAVEVVTKGVESLLFDRDELSLNIGSSACINATVLPADYGDVTLVWSSEDETVASVDDNGVVTAVSSGETEVTASVGDIKAICKVICIGVPVDSLKISADELSLPLDSDYQLSAAIHPYESSDKNLKWESSDESVVTVDNNGLVHTLSVGEAEITVSCAGKSAGCKISVYDPEALNVGNYLYSDGTYSLELDESKTVIGVVFYVGDPTEDDEALKREHPECTHGLAVAINGQKKSSWLFSFGDVFVGSWIEENTEYRSCTVSDPQSEELNRISGYNNTKGIELYNASGTSSPHYAVQEIVSYRDQTTCPDNTSDWYMPSIKELSLLCSGEYEGNIFEVDGGAGNIDIINASLEKIEGAQLISLEDNLWSSTEYNGQCAYSIKVERGDVQNDWPKFNGGPSVRAIIAF